jgi:hypothetical protein
MNIYQYSSITSNMASTFSDDTSVESCGSVKKVAVGRRTDHRSGIYAKIITKTEDIDNILAPGG